ncbi:MAG: hypothetical protein NTZ67_03560 [Gammaproteobacteria bacterium]|nr:hypothetical protein [Gammaproteobacteria bacterium]
MSKYGKIYPVSFGFALGVISGLGTMLLCWMGARYGFGLPVIALMGLLYHHAAPTLIGGLWGFFWGFLHMFVFGVLAAWIYNGTTGCFCPAGSCDSDCK